MYKCKDNDNRLQVKKVDGKIDELWTQCEGETGWTVFGWEDVKQALCLYNVGSSAFFLGQQVRHNADNCPFTVTGLCGNKLRLKGDWSGGTQPINAESWVDVSEVSEW